MAMPRAMKAPSGFDGGTVRVGARIVLGVLVFGLLAVAITGKPTKRLNDFDQSFYLTIAFDLDRHGVFSNGIFDDTDSTATQPSPGMFFGPVYPLLVLAATKVDSRFAKALECAVESNHRKRDPATCDIYARPIHLLHALLLALGVLAIAFSAEVIFGRQPIFYVSGALATLALLPEADLFSYIMTESATFALYSLTAAALVWGLRTGRTAGLAVAGLALGLLVLTRPSFLVLAPVMAILILLAGRFGRERNSLWTRILAFGIAFAIIVVPWMTRNVLSVGKWGLTEEYGAVSVVERFAFNRMTAREFTLAFPYCLPAAGPWLVERLAGPDAMARFDWRDPNGFFSRGRAHRVALVEQHGRLDPVIGALVRGELRESWWRHLLTTLPLAWCGLWVGQMVGLGLIPLFAWACVRAVRQREGLFLLYAAPPLMMVGLHAAVANHYIRYNLILIGPASAGTAWIIAWLISAARKKTRPAG
jgi:hypothetical protein